MIPGAWSKRNNRRDTNLPGIGLKTVPKILFFNLKLKVAKFQPKTFLGTNVILGFYAASIVEGQM